MNAPDLLGRQIVLARSRSALTYAPHAMELRILRSDHAPPPAGIDVTLVLSGIVFEWRAHREAPVRPTRPTSRAVVTRTRSR